MNTLFTPRNLIRLLIILLLLPLLPFLITWRWNWWEAWAYGIIHVIGFIVSRVFTAQKHPDLLEERAQSIALAHDDTEQFDKIIVPLIGLGFVLVPLFAGFEARFGPVIVFSLPVKLTALLLIVLGYGFASWAMIENRFFSGTVRIQKERDHVLVDTGPYKFIRHPGYTGAMLSYLAAPILLDSLWTFFPVGMLCAILVIRTLLEDRFLQAQLPGYTEYMERTKYRLLPGCW